MKVEESTRSFRNMPMLPTIDNVDIPGFVEKLP